MVLLYLQRKITKRQKTDNNINTMENGRGVGENVVGLWIL